MVNKRCVLFVDDDPRILRGLRRQLGSLSNQWEMAFAESGAAALNVLKQSEIQYDVIVSDIRMPGMDGIALLKMVEQQYPHMIRIVLSAQVDRQSVIRAVGLAHQFISKPCRTENILNILDRAFSLRALLTSVRIKKLLAQLRTLPSLPELYRKLMEEIQQPEPSIKKIGWIISQDMGMTAKILQLVNSAFFGLRRQISNPTQAVILLGIDTIRALVLSVHVFSQFKSANLEGISLAQLQEHSFTVATFAKQIAQSEQLDQQLVDFSFTAGLLHDVGRLVLATNLPTEYAEALALKESLDIDLPKAERLVFEATHAEAGAYLLGIWGLPDEVVEALAFHHNPFENISKNFCALTAVHVANSLAHQTQSLGEPGLPPKIDIPYLEQLGYRENLSQWQTLCREIV